MKAGGYGPHPGEPTRQPPAVWGSQRPGRATLRADVETHTHSAASVPQGRWDRRPQPWRPETAGAGHAKL